MTVIRPTPQTTPALTNACQAPAAEFRNVPLADIQQDWRMLTETDENVLHFLNDPAYHELDRHLRAYGQFFPIVVRPSDKSGTRFRIVDGVKRFITRQRQYQEQSDVPYGNARRFAVIPALVVDSDDVTAALMAFLARRGAWVPITAPETGAYLIGLKMMLERQLNHEVGDRTLASYVGKSATWCLNYRRVTEVITSDDLVAAGLINEGLFDRQTMRAIPLGTWMDVAKVDAPERRRQMLADAAKSVRSAGTTDSSFGSAAVEMEYAGERLERSDAAPLHAQESTPRGTPPARARSSRTRLKRAPGDQMAWFNHVQESTERQTVEWRDLRSMSSERRRALLDRLAPVVVACTMVDDVDARPYVQVPAGPGTCIVITKPLAQLSEEERQSLIDDILRSGRL